ncbi:MAG TPA: aminotransferase class V-fold PLP-dependent enzyme [Patescibacteria group bacterium]|nr:aminotransferase class V-fold PLP-dependent enzyme [Patescibacteria group bacterium]
MKDSIKDGLLSPALLKDIRDRFFYPDWCPFAGKRIYLEASGGSLRLKKGVEAMAREASLPDELFRFNPASDHVVAVLEKGIEDVKTFLGAKSGSILPGQSATHAISRAVNTITEHIPGKNIVTTELEHPAVHSPTQYFAEVRNKEYRTARLSKETSSVPAKNVLELIDKETCVLVLAHASNQTGAVNDVKTIIQEARKIKPDLYTVVDAVQYAPHGPIDVEDIGADAYAFGPYKAYGPKGIGFAHLSDRLSVLPHEKLIGKPENNWVMGSQAQMMYASWSEVVDYLCWLGSHFTESKDRRKQVVAAKDAITAHMQALLHRALYGTGNVSGLLAMDHITVCNMGSPVELSNRLCIFLFRVNHLDSSKASEFFNKKYGVRVSARIRDTYSKVPLDAMGWQDAVRLSSAHYNTPEEFDVFLDAARKMADET